MSDVRQYIDYLQMEQPTMVHLARLVACAVRVDPPLLRAMRQQFLPETDAGLEADLWFSHLVQHRSADGIVLYGPVADALREDLAAQAPEQYETSWLVLETMHRHLDPALRLEEEVAYLAFSQKPGAEERTRALIKAAVRAMVHEDRKGLVNWAARALPRFPARLLVHEETAMLAAGTSLRLEGDLPGVPVLTEKTNPEMMAWLAPEDMSQVEIGVRLFPGLIEVDAGSSFVSDARVISIPSTTPLVLDIEWGRDEYEFDYVLLQENAWYMDSRYEIKINDLHNRLLEEGLRGSRPFGRTGPLNVQNIQKAQRISPDPEVDTERELRNARAVVCPVFPQDVEGLSEFKNTAVELAQRLEKPITVIRIDGASVPEILAEYFERVLEDVLERRETLDDVVQSIRPDHSIRVSLDKGDLQLIEIGQGPLVLRTVLGTTYELETDEKNELPLAGIRVFISSSFRGLEEQRIAVNEAITKLGGSLVAMESSPSEGQSINERILDSIKSSDVYVGIIGSKYSEYVESEYTIAGELGIPILIFLESENNLRISKIVDRDRDKIEAFRDSLSQSHVVGYFESPEELAREVTEGLLALFQDVQRAEKNATEEAAGVGYEPQSQSLKENYSVLPIFYGTNRARDKDGSYSGERNETLLMGKTTVSIPASHEVGRIETPSAFNIFSRARPEKHIVVQSLEESGEAEFWDSLRKAHPEADSALIYVHGYNEEMDYVLKRTAQFAYDLPFDGIPIVYSWPSKGNVSSYMNDQATVQWAVRHFARFVEKIIDQQIVQEIHLVSHGLGARLVIDFLTQHNSLFESTSVRLKHVVFAAPDVDADYFTQSARQFPEPAGRYTLYFNAEDRSLGVVSAFSQGQRAGRSPIVAKNVDQVDVSSIESTLIGHEYFASNRTVLQDLYVLIINNLPPEERNLTSVDLEYTTYWRFERNSDLDRGISIPLNMPA